MTVRELMERLKDAEPDAPVVIRVENESVRVRHAYYDSAAYIITRGSPKKEHEGRGLFILRED